MFYNLFVVKQWCCKFLFDSLFDHMRKETFKLSQFWRLEHQVGVIHELIRPRDQIDNVIALNSKK